MNTSDSTTPDRPEPSSEVTEPSHGTRHLSPFTFKENVGRLLWSIVQSTLFSWSPKPLYGFRRWLLRMFGAKIGKSAIIRPSVRLECPWKLILEDHATIGDHAYLYNFDLISIGPYATVSQFAYLCTGTHELETIEMQLITAPIKMEAHSWVAAHTFVGPGVTIGHHSVLGAKSSIFKDLNPLEVAVGCPAKVIKKRTVEI